MMNTPPKLSVPSRVEAFVRARDSGMSIAEAREYSDSIYQSTAEDIRYQKQLRDECKLDSSPRSANMAAAAQHRWWRLGNPLWELTHIDKIITDPTIGNWAVVRTGLVIAALLSFALWLSL
jgi:hypothetical protein